MLVLPIHRILITIVVFLVYATAEDTSDASGSLFNMVPDCAKDCVESFIKSEYTPTECTSPSNVNCLCRTKTPDGLTLGEAALSCVLSLCSKEVIADSKAYHICDSVAGAIPKTHKTITATVFSDVSTTLAGDPTTTEAVVTGSTTTSENSSEAPLTTSSTTPGSTSASVSTSTSTSTTSSRTSEITFYDASSSSSPVQTTSSTEQNAMPSSGLSEDTNKKGDHSISPGAVIGMSVASGVAGSFIIIVAVIFCCKRWRKKHRDQSEPHTFEIGGAMSEPPDFSKPMPRLPSSGSGPRSFHSRTIEDETSQPRTFQPMATVSNIQSPMRYSPQFATVSHAHSHQRQGSRDQERIGFAISSDSDWETSPRTQSSQHSVARLLPDSAGLYPKPLKWSHRPASGETLFEEDETQQTAAMMRNDPRPGTQPRLAGLAGLPANPRAFKKIPAANFKRRSGPRTLAPPFNPTTSTTSESSAQTNTPSPTHRTPSQPTPQPQSSPIHLPQGTEIISRPRIVRKDDIKRVQIRSSPRPPSEVVAPYCPEDLWLERGRNDRTREVSGELPYPSDMYPGVVGYPDSPKKRTGVENRVSPTSRNLTPSRRGQDLILRVD